jgi:hypothetical protein
VERNLQDETYYVQKLALSSQGDNGYGLNLE